MTKLDMLKYRKAGVTGSFFVSIVVELSGNYRNNKLAWQELQDYYSIVDEYETIKQVYMENTPSQRAEKKARNEFVDSIFKSDVGTKLTDEIMEELKNIAEEHSKDIIESTWEQLPKIIPVLRRTLDEKKAFLNDDEIFALRVIIDNYLQIRHEVMELLQMSPILYDIFNSPDREFLNYPQNILENLPKWMKKCLATNEGQNAMERLTDSVMSDQFMLSYFMNDYEISIRGLDEYHSVLGDESD